MPPLSRSQHVGSQSWVHKDRPQPRRLLHNLLCQTFPVANNIRASGTRPQDSRKPDQKTANMAFFHSDQLCDDAGESIAAVVFVDGISPRKNQPKLTSRLARTTDTPPPFAIPCFRFSLLLVASHLWIGSSPQQISYTSRFRAKNPCFSERFHI